MISPKSRQLKTLNNIEYDQNLQSGTAASNSTTTPYLPDNVIEQILSFLPIKLVTQATTVSKRWADLWPSLPIIDFDEGDPTDPDDPAKHQRFIRFLRNCLERCEKQTLVDKFRLRMRYHGVGEDEDIVDDWIVFAILTCVKEFDLCLVRGGEFRDVWTTDLNEDVDRLYLIPQRIFSSNCLTSLKLENVSYFSRATGTPISLPSLKTMSLKHVECDEKDGDHRALPRLISGCPRLEHLSLNQCNLGLSTLSLKISSFSLKSLEIMDCHSLDLVVETINLVSFKLVSEYSYPYHYDLTLMNCEKLKHLRISSVGLKKLSLLSCCCRMENSIFTPNLVSVMFSGRVKAKVHFVEAPSNLLDAKIGVCFEKRQSTFNYYSDLRAFLESFNCAREVEISIRDVEGVIIPEPCRMEWSPPLPSIKQLQLIYLVPFEDRHYRLNSSLAWIAPSAEILPHQRYFLIRYNKALLLGMK